MVLVVAEIDAEAAAPHLTCRAADRSGLAHATLASAPGTAIAAGATVQGVGCQVDAHLAALLRTLLALLLPLPFAQRLRRCGQAGRYRKPGQQPAGPSPADAAGEPQSKLVESSLVHGQLPSICVEILRRTGRSRCGDTHMSMRPDLRARAHESSLWNAGVIAIRRNTYIDAMSPSRQQIGDHGQRPETSGNDTEERSRTLRICPAGNPAGRQVDISKAQHAPHERSGMCPMSQAVRCHRLVFGGP